MALSKDFVGVSYVSTDSVGDDSVSYVSLGPNLMLDSEMGPTTSVDWSYDQPTNVLTRTGSSGGCTFGVEPILPIAYHLVDGAQYLIEYDVTGHSGDSWSHRLGGSTTSGAATGNGFHSTIMTAEVTNNDLKIIAWGGGAAAAVFSNMSLRLMLASIP